jgi:hypothetical protein
MERFALYFAFQIFLTYVYSYARLKSINIVPSIIKKKDIYRDLSLIIQDKKYDIYIINDSIFNNQYMKKDVTKLIFEDNLISFKELSFNEYITNKPILFCRDTIFYINDYLINDGRILNEQEKLTILKKNYNYVFLQSNDIDTIPLKDVHFNKKFRMLDFPIILKKDLINYIYELIDHFQYNENLYLVDWDSFEIDKLNFTDINMLLNKIEKYYFRYNTADPLRANQLTEQALRGSDGVYSLQKTPINTTNLNNSNFENLNKYIVTIINILKK